MTSGEFTSFPVSEIWVDRTKRQRKELTGIEELAASIARVGLIHPPVIERTGELRVGERRLTAVRSLGWTHVSVQFIDELSEHELQLVELEENLRRINLDWKDECLAVKSYHDLRTQEAKDWTAARTAEALGVSDVFVSQRLGVAGELVKGNERVAAAPKYSTARNIVNRTQARRNADLADTIADVLEAPRPKVPLINADFHLWLEEYEGPKFNFIHCDFPYGINANEHDQGQAALAGGYEDTEEVYWALVKLLARAMNEVVAESAHLMFWFSMDYYGRTMNALNAMGWSVNPFPLIWYKSDNTGILPDPNRGPRRIYETAFFASRGDRLLSAHGAVSNAVAHPGQDKSIHMSEKPVPMLRHFMRMIVDENSTVLDPTCGSGNALKAATALGAASVLGIEKDEEFYGRAVENWTE